jgi:hypothetical protein
MCCGKQSLDSERATLTVGKQSVDSLEEYVHNILIFILFYRFSSTHYRKKNVQLPGLAK